MRFEGFTVFVTGGAGFIGSHTVDALVEGVAGGVVRVCEEDDVCRARGRRGPAHLGRHGPRVAVAPEVGTTVYRFATVPAWA